MKDIVTSSPKLTVKFRGGFRKKIPEKILRTSKKYKNTTLKFIK